MEILYVISNLEKCGPVNVLFNIVSQVSITNHCTILTLSPERENSMLNDFKISNVNIVQLNLERKVNERTYLNNITSIVEKINPDIIHTHGFRSDRYIKKINKNNNYKHFTTLHNFPFDDYPRLYGRIKGGVLALMHIYVIGKIKYKVACSNSILKKFKKIFMKDIEVVQNGVNLEEFKSVSLEERRDIRKKLNIDDNKIVVISTGALINRKRPLILMEVFESMVVTNENLLFIVLGQGELYPKVKEYETNNIRVLGFVHDVKEYLQVSDIFITNSKAEGLPMAMLEAASIGLIVIGSDISPHREAKDLIGERTILYSGQDKANITKAINEGLLLINKQEERTNNKRNISSKSMAEKYLYHYENVNNK